MEIRKQLDQQRKWKAEVVKRTASARLSAKVDAEAKAAAAAAKAK